MKMWPDSLDDDAKGLQFHERALGLNRMNTTKVEKKYGSTPSAAENVERRHAFVTTHWSVVLTAGRSDTTRARKALARLCQTYWYPLYAYVRRRGHSAHDAQDLTQEFFARLLEGNWIAKADRDKGRFRSFLLMVMGRFLANEWNKAETLKRGGHVQLLSLTLDTAETRYAKEPADTSTPEQAFEKQWALALLEEVLQHLRNEYVNDDKEIVFDKLKPCLIGSRETQPYAVLAGELGMTEGAVKTAVCRLRERYRERLQAEIANTVASPSEVDSELRHLFRILARG
jgi:RNA polymerase sigma factor (sigma-70 family)